MSPRHIPARNISHMLQLFDICLARVHANHPRPTGTHIRGNTIETEHICHTGGYLLIDPHRSTHRTCGKGHALTRFMGDFNYLAIGDKHHRMVTDDIAATKMHGPPPCQHHVLVHPALLDPPRPPAPSPEEMQAATAVADGPLLEIVEKLHLDPGHVGIGGRHDLPEGVDEDRIEVVVPAPVAQAVVAAVRAAHPYEEPVWHLLAPAGIGE